MKLRYSPRARRDVADIGRYIRERDPAAAVAVRDALRASLTMLARYPHGGANVGQASLHRFVVPRLPYCVFYLVDEPADVLRIVTIRHTSRQEEN